MKAGIFRRLIGGNPLKIGKVMHESGYLSSFNRGKPFENFESDS